MNTKLVSSIETLHFAPAIVGIDTWLKDAQAAYVHAYRPCRRLGPDGKCGGHHKKGHRPLIGTVPGGLQTRAADVMTQDVTSLLPDRPLARCPVMMQQRGFVHIPVVDEHYIR